MRAIFLAGLAAMALGGCQSADEKLAAETGEVKLANASMQDVARLTKAARAKTLLQPGQWHTELRIDSADLAGLSEADRAKQMEAIKGQEKSATGCRTAEDLKPFDIDNLEQVAGSCTFPRYNQSGGKLDIEVHCGEGAAKSVLVATGTMSKTGYDVTIRQTTGTQGTAGYLGLVLHAKGDRTGNCVAKPKN
ncbi:DUF3617 domain-containing protein [Sphingomonas soli]|uniref:DUF3617 domain-containing protein n=1 Tax=Sphingomonas soli TaxID=266127 RepID=UPI00082E9B21|nr:DUF3617 family protein [Sphingomonas soli]